MPREDLDVVVATLTGEVALIAVWGLLDPAATDRIERAIDEAMSTDPKAIAFDLSGVHLSVPSAAREVLRQARRLAGRERDVAIVCNDPRLSWVFKPSESESREVGVFATLHDVLDEFGADGSARLDHVSAPA